MNQSNFDIGEVLKASLVKEQPSVSFENIWNKYSEQKRPNIAFKRMSILVAAILLVVVSRKYITSIVRLPSNQENTDKIVVKNFAADTAKDKNSKIMLNRIAPKTSTQAPESNATARITSDTAPRSKVIAPSAKKALQAAPFAASSLAAEPSESLIVWNNNVYKKTTTTVSLKELGTRLGEIKKMTDKPKLNWEANLSPLGTVLYTIKGEDSKKVIAIKIEGVCYRAIKIDVK